MRGDAGDASCGGGDHGSRWELRRVARAEGLGALESPSGRERREGGEPTRDDDVCCRCNT
jgi:hypothetical protein